MSTNCSWKLNNDPDFDITYETQCGKTFVMIEGDFKDNDMIYCCYCGKKIKERFPLEEVSDSIFTKHEIELINLEVNKRLKTDYHFLMKKMSSDDSANEEIIQVSQRLFNEIAREKFPESYKCFLDSSTKKVSMGLKKLSDNEGRSYTDLWREGEGF